MSLPKYIVNFLDAIPALVPKRNTKPPSSLLAQKIKGYYIHASRGEDASVIEFFPITETSINGIQISATEPLKKASFSLFINDKPFMEDVYLKGKKFFDMKHFVAPILINKGDVLTMKLQYGDKVEADILIELHYIQKKVGI